MSTARLITTFTVTGILSTLFACSDTAAPLGTHDLFINDTAGQDVYSPPPPMVDSGSDGAYATGPVTSPCSSCSCDPTKNYCFAGASSSTVVYDSGSVTETGPDEAGGENDSGGDARAALPLGIFAQPDAAMDAGPPPPPCSMLAAGSTTPGCTSLPAACSANPTCACLLMALQPLYDSCYLVCTPSPGYIEVYCGG